MITVRLVLEITRTRDGRYEGRLTLPGADGAEDFVGILELLAIIEQLFQSEGQKRPPGGPA
jgi:hypothetical protein